jgi:hypothetical protein
LNGGAGFGHQRLQRGGEPGDLLWSAITRVDDVAVIGAENHAADVVVEDQVGDVGRIRRVRAIESDDEQLPDAHVRRHALKQVGDEGVFAAVLGQDRASRSQQQSQYEYAIDQGDETAAHVLSPK